MSGRQLLKDIGSEMGIDEEKSSRDVNVGDPTAPSKEVSSKRQSLSDIVSLVFNHLI